MAKKKYNLLKTISGLFLLFGFSGLVYGFVPYPYHFIIGIGSIVLCYILILISKIKKRKKN